ncbi:hypothetical protein TURU_034073 [Turdus rufiventris]|nr:hypothetical protein TURU_034073 [Turdus rufiventris]
MVSVDPGEERLGGTYKHVMQETRKDRVKLYSCADGKREKADTTWNIAKENEIKSFYVRKTCHKADKENNCRIIRPKRDIDYSFAYSSSLSKAMPVRRLALHKKVKGKTAGTDDPN